MLNASSVLRYARRNVRIIVEKSIADMDVEMLLVTCVVVLCLGAVVVKYGQVLVAVIMVRVNVVKLYCEIAQW